MAKKPPTQLAPASARHAALPSALEEQSLKAIERTLGGREGLVAALSHAPRSRDLEYLLGLIGDPAMAKIPLGHLCAQGGVTPGELLAAWKSGEILRGHVLATRQVIAALPAVVADVLKHAAPHEDTCSACQGVGEVTPEPTKKQPNPKPITCPACRGGGTLEYPADLERAKIALDLAQLTPKGGPGIALTLNSNTANFGGGAAGGTLESLMAASDKILYGEQDEAPQPIQAPPAEAIDAEPLPGPDSGPE